MWFPLHKSVAAGVLKARDLATFVGKKILIQSSQKFVRDVRVMPWKGRLAHLGIKNNYYGSSKEGKRRRGK